jgi:hypothetical protein
MQRTIITSLAFATLALAHGGFDHVTGTVLSTHDSVITVLTAKGKQDVKLDSKTEITKGTQKAVQADILPGMRVIVDIPEESKLKPPVAHSVKIGVVTTTKPAK